MSHVIVDSKSGIKKAFGAIIVDNVMPDAYKEGLMRAQIRQEVVTTYPATRPTDGISDSLYSTEEVLGNSEGQSYQSQRVCWILVPSDKTVEQVQADMAKHPEATIFQQLSFDVEDVLSPNQKDGVAAGLTTLEALAESLKVQRPSESNPEMMEDVLDRRNNRLIYRKTFFSITKREDVDMRDYEKYPPVPNAEGNITSNRLVDEAVNSGGLY